MDIELSTTGDIILSAGDATPLTINGMITQRIFHILRSKPGDWAMYPTLGANVTQYVGYPNTPASKSLIESELSEELSKDYILKNFQIKVEYTPLSRSESIIEITVYLPNDQLIQTTFNLSPNGGLFTNDGLPYTPASFSEETELITEIVNIASSINRIKISRIPIDNIVHILPYAEDLNITENGIGFPKNEITQVIDFSSGIPNEQINNRIYALSGNISNILDTKLISDIEITADNIETYELEDYKLTSSSLEILDIYTNIDSDGEVIQHGIATLPSGTLEIKIDYYDSKQIESIDTYEIDGAINNLFARLQVPGETIITTSELLSPGPYYVQYLSYKLEV